MSNAFKAVLLLAILCASVVNVVSQVLQPKATIISNSLVIDSPAFKACHASSIVELSQGKFMATWFAGEYEGHKEVSIYTATFSDGKWSTAKMVADGVIRRGVQFPCWNPVLFKSSANLLFLFYKVGPNPREWWGMMKTSTNGGKTWSGETALPDGFLGPIRNKPIQLDNGNILHPSSTESKDEKIWNVHFEVSDSTGTNWMKIPVNNDTFGIIQPTILQHNNNKLQMLCRSRHNAIVQSWSTDDGITWSPLTKLPTKNPNSGIDAVTTRSGLHVLVYNPAVAGKDWMNGRNELRVAVSPDGINWTDVHTLEKHDDGEYSYPAIIESSDGNLHITYTYNRKNIRHVVLKL